MIIGIEMRVKFEPPAPFTTEWIDAIYSSLERNMAIKSIDLFSSEDAGEIKFVLGIDGFNHCEDDFFEGVAREAIERALEDAAGPNRRGAGQEPVPGKQFSFA